MRKDWNERAAIMDSILIEELKKVRMNIEQDETCFDNFFLALNMFYKPEKNILDLVGEDLFYEGYNYKNLRT